jgi:hypothetical protein
MIKLNGFFKIINKNSGANGLEGNQNIGTDVGVVRHIPIKVMKAEASGKVVRRKIVQGQSYTNPVPL